MVVDADVGAGDEAVVQLRAVARDLAEGAPRVAAVVVNFDGKDITAGAVASLRRMTYPAFDVVVLDNGSRDGSSQHLAALYPDLLQIHKRVNQGSGAGYCLGMRWAVEHGYDYVLLLNNDIEVEPSMLDELVRLAESDPRFGAVGPKCYYWSDRRRLWSAGGRLRFRESITAERGHRQLDDGRFDGPESVDVDYVNGCAILIRCAAVREVGLWDPLFFICVDDADFCTRLRRAGWRRGFASRAVLYHMVAVTTGGYTARRNFDFGRSSALYARRHGRLHQRLAFVLAILASTPWAWLREARRGNGRAVWGKWKGVWAGLREPLGPPPTLEAPPALEP